MTFAATSTLNPIGTPTDVSRSVPSPMDQEFAQRTISGADAVLEQAESLLQQIGSESYSQTLSVAFDASIGGHIRHCLDHFSSWLSGAESGFVDYDHRRRDPRIEKDPAFAIGVVRQLRDVLAQIEPGRLSNPVKARCEVSYAPGASPVVDSTLGRELVYVVAHAIHHFALISVMAKLLTVSLGEHFGVAPSTVAHRRTDA